MQLYTALTTASAMATFSAMSAMAQNTTNTTTSSLIPTDISPACTTFMTNLNSDPLIATCTAPLLSATQYYANATSTTSNTTSSAAALTSSLSQLCDNNTGCDSDLIRTYLSQFWTACDTEIRAKNVGVQDVYDVLYLINPFHEAVCTKDDSNNYCVLNIATDTASKAADNTTTSRRSLFTNDDHSNLKRQDASETASAIEGSSLSSTNIAFLFLQTTSAKSVLCSSCSKNILAAYISFETSIPYAIGLANSDILKGQSALYSTMKSTCGDDFTTSINEAAGTTAFAEVGGAGSLTTRTGFALVMAAIAAIAVFV
ncbi:hypothetical protein CBS101457_000580 [Exobasidium rhododendri]|nr:hypothetical protein CBS101457_000580 [Exobasidium rhododendri]